MSFFEVWLTVTYSPLGPSLTAHQALFCLRKLFWHHFETSHKVESFVPGGCFPSFILCCVWEEVKWASRWVTSVHLLQEYPTAFLSLCMQVWQLQCEWMYITCHCITAAVSGGGMLAAGNTNESPFQQFVDAAVTVMNLTFTFLLSQVAKPLVSMLLLWQWWLMKTTVWVISKYLLKAGGAAPNPKQVCRPHSLMVTVLEDLTCHDAVQPT